MFIGRVELCECMSALKDLGRKLYNPVVLALSPDPRHTTIGGVSALYRVGSYVELWQVRDFMGEEEFIKPIVEGIRPSDVVWDVGANAGLYSCLFANAGGTVHAFEPDSTNLDRLRENIRLNDAREAVAVHRVALGDTEQQQEMFVTETSGPIRPSARFPSEGDTRRSGERHEVTVRRGDSVDVTPPDVLKVDVEGYECNVLRGLGDRLGECRAVFVEVHTGLGVTKRDVNGVLRDAGLEPDVLYERDSDDAVFIRAM